MITLGITGRSGLRQIYCHAGLCPAGCPAGGCGSDIPGDPGTGVRRCCRSWHSVLDGTWWTRRDGWTAAPWRPAFATPEGKADLDALTHPEIIRRIRQAKQEAQAAGCKLFVLDGAVIVGTAAQAECDRLAVVTAPFETSVARIAARDGISPEMAARRLNAQTPEAELTAPGGLYPAQ